MSAIDGVTRRRLESQADIAFEQHRRPPVSHLRILNTGKTWTRRRRCSYTWGTLAPLVCVVHSGRKKSNEGAVLVFISNQKKRC